ncbi:MAG TPA: hypothetical protein VGP76_03395 [Planctomycetaceae bacterium]|jgi:hypothetical protein|nr:hypothetical protein [Planctomycetaceae bacterium]
MLYPWNHPYRWIEFFQRGDLSSGVRERKNVRPLMSIAVAPGRKLPVALEDSVALRLPEDQRARTLAECKLAADVTQQDRKHWLSFLIFDGYPARRPLRNGWTRYERPSIAEASRVMLELHVCRDEEVFDSRKGLIPQFARYLRKRAAELIATAERLERVDAKGGAA